MAFRTMFGESFDEKLLLSERHALDDLVADISGVHCFFSCITGDRTGCLGMLHNFPC